MDTLAKPEVTSLLWGGSKGGGKSVLGCVWMYLKCLSTINRFRLTTRKHPIQIGFMGRKQSVDFTDTTLETWKTFIPSDTYELRTGDKEIIIQNAVKISYGGFDSQESVKKFNSAEFAYIFIDQAEEITRDDYGLVKGTLRRKINDTELDYKILLTANPADCWLKDEFINRLPKGNAFLQALPKDNSFLPKGYVQNLIEAFQHRPELVQAYVYGNWDVLTGFDLVIKPEWVKRNINRLTKPDSRRVVVCDPARFGDDETVIYVMEGYKVIHTLILHNKSTMEVAGNLIALHRQFSSFAIAVDVCGLGAGIVDRIVEQGHQVISINSAFKPTIETEQVKYMNLRAQMYWEAGAKLSNDQVSVEDDRELINQLTSTKYKLNSRGLIQIESKDDIKARLGRSPDRSDAFVMGLYAIDQVPIIKTDFYRIESNKQPSGYGWQLAGAFNG